SSKQACIAASPSGRRTVDLTRSASRAGRNGGRGISPPIANRRSSSQHPPPSRGCAAGTYPPAVVGLISSKPTRPGCPQRACGNESSPASQPPWRSSWTALSLVARSTPGRLSPRIASLPLDLVRHDLIMNRAPAPDKTLVEIVDRIFLPLVLAGRPEQTGQAVSPASA